MVLADRLNLNKTVKIIGKQIKQTSGNQRKPARKYTKGVKSYNLKVMKNILID